MLVVWLAGGAPPVRGRAGDDDDVAAAAADDDDDSAIRVLGDFGGRAALNRMPAYALTDILSTASTATSGTIPAAAAAAAAASGLLLMFLEIFLRDSISDRMSSCLGGRGDE